MVSETSKYDETGVDAHKKGIDVFKSTIENLFPDAFCVIQQDPDFPDYVVITHTDGAGSKPVQAYLHWRETGDFSVFDGLAQDVIAMNLGDTDCVGSYPISFVDYVAINRLRVLKEEFLEALNKGLYETSSLLKSFNIDIHLAGGETADLPDQLRTLDVSGTIVARAKKSDIITGEKIKPGDIIVGLRSGGKAVYEDKINSGLMCNGITLARHCLMSPDYEVKYPEIRDPEGKEYYGKFRTDEYNHDLGMTVGGAILSPTRLFSPIIKKILKNHKDEIHGLVQNTGGGQTKCLRIGRNIHYIKDNLPKPDPIFHLVRQKSGEDWRFMHEDYNMGIGFDVIVPEYLENHVISIAMEFGIGAQRTGYCEESGDRNRLTIKSRHGEFRYP